MKLRCSVVCPVLLAVVFGMLILICSSPRKYPVHSTGGILITGASSGIGRHAAVSLAKKGYVVFAGCRKEKDVASIASENLSTLRGIIIDVTKQDQVDAARDLIAKELAARGEPFVALVNNAGVGGASVVELMDIEAAKHTFDVNYFGVVRATKAFLPLLRQTGAGSRIVQISSVAGVISSMGSNPYSATKFALESLNDALRLELDEWGISTSAINPAYVSTKILTKASTQRVEDVNRYSESEKILYKHIMNEASRAKSEKMYAKADSPQVTTDVIEHAIMSPHPKVRYVCANVDGTPAWRFVYLKWFLPARMFDQIVLAVAGK